LTQNLVAIPRDGEITMLGGISDVTVT